MLTSEEHARLCNLAVGDQHAPRRPVIHRRAGTRAATFACFMLLTVVALYPALATARTVGPHDSAHAAVRHKATRTDKRKQKMAPTIEMKLLGTSVSPLLTDGERWAVYEPKAGVTKIMDTLTGKTVERTDPEGCSEGLYAISSSDVMYECDDPECPEQARHCYVEPFDQGESRLYVLANLASGAQQIVPDTSDVPISLPTLGGKFSMGAISSQWASGAGSEAFFINLHTGQRVNQRELEQKNNEVYDLNEAALIKPMCAPLTLEEVVYEGEPGINKYLSAKYDPPFAVIDAYGAGYGYLRRCGSTKRLELLNQCGSGSVGSVIAGDVLICGEDFITQLSSSRPYPWHGVVYRLKRLGPEREFESIENTATMIFATVTHQPGHIYFARLPWVQSTHAHTRSAQLIFGSN